MSRSNANTIEPLLNCHPMCYEKATEQLKKKMLVIEDESLNSPVNTSVELQM